VERLRRLLPTHFDARQQPLKPPAKGTLPPPSAEMRMLFARISLFEDLRRSTVMVLEDSTGVESLSQHLACGDDVRL